MNYDSAAMLLHEQNRGKLEVTSKVEIKNKEDLSAAYSPGVGAVSLAISKDPELTKSLTLKSNTVAIVSDGSAILGLGNLGAKAAIPVMEGKAVLFKQFGGVDAFPICLDTQDTEEIIRTVKSIAPVFAGINLEDISAPRCFEIEARLREELDIPVLHDDQHGTAVVVLAGLTNALKLAGKDKASVKVVVSGAGAAGRAIINLLLADGYKNILVGDSMGIIHSGREDLDSYKTELSKITNLAEHNGTVQTGSIIQALAGADVFIGVSKAGLLNETDVKTMGDKPIIFALANPDPEIMPDVALSAGAFIVATGRSDFANQVNNVLAFPGLFRGAIDNGIKQFTESMLISAAHALADATTDLSAEKILPSPFEPAISQKIASVIKQ